LFVPKEEAKPLDNLRPLAVLKPSLGSLLLLPPNRFY